MNPFSRWRQRRALERGHANSPPDLWARVIVSLPLLDGLDAGELSKLRDLAVLFLQAKTLELAQGAQIDETTRLALALQASLPVLELGLQWYRGWHAIILYPDEFVPTREVVGEDGIVWIDDGPKSGEAWERGPVIVSLADARAGATRDGYNVVIHELAHKLDMRDGRANGHPPLHSDMSHARWASELSRAYDDLCRHIDAGDETLIDPYGGESPAEFFAVCSEAFFEIPDVLQDQYPEVYAQLRQFYRQDPALRLAPVNAVW